jgi:hypothetical protein
MEDAETILGDQEQGGRIKGAREVKVGVAVAKWGEEAAGGLDDDDVRGVASHPGSDAVKVDNDTGATRGDVGGDGIRERIRRWVVDRGGADARELRAVGVALANAGLHRLEANDSEAPTRERGDERDRCVGLANTGAGSNDDDAVGLGTHAPP